MTWQRRLLCEWLGWHVPGGHTRWFDGCNVYARCRGCGRELMQDSQGNWF